VRAVGSDQSDRAVPLTEQHKVFAQQPDTDRSTTGLAKIGYRNNWNPVLPEQMTHQRSRPDFRQPVIFFSGKIGQIFSPTVIHGLTFHTGGLSISFASLY
jgi:hypothetical protein